MRRDYLYLMAWVLPVGLAMVACKPSERGYKAAYEVAVKKHESARDALGADSEKIIMLGGPRAEKAGDEEIYIDRSIIVSPAGEERDDRSAGPLAIALSRFRMQSNAAAQLKDLAGTCSEAFFAKDGNDNYYVILSRCKDKEEAAVKIAELREKYPEFRFVGLNDSPLVVMSGRAPGHKAEQK